LTFLESYLEHTRIYESPTSFWLWSGYSTIAATLRDSVWLSQGDGKLFPNIYVLLLAGSGQRKGKPVDLANKLMNDLAHIKVIAGRSSIQAILIELSRTESSTHGKIIKGGSAIFYAPELTAAIVADPAAVGVLTDIYESWPGMMDHRFKAYAGRRFTQLIKLCCIEAVAARRNVISVQDAIRANTWLSLTEALMPRALGEYGAGRNSMGSNAIMNVFYAKPDVHWKLDQLWEQTSSAFDTMLGFNTAVTGLLSAKKLALDNGHLTLTRALIPHGKYIKPDLFSEYLN